MLRTENTSSTLKGSCSQLSEMFEEIAKHFIIGPERLIFASVRSCAENKKLIATVQCRYSSIICYEVTVSDYALGVQNGYLIKEQLGLDRWLGVVAAYNVSGKKACVVIDAGTAITIDLVDSAGQHLGGYICPGFTLMREQLQAKTRKIRYEQESSVTSAINQPERPGVSTLECVERGCFLMIADFLQAQLARSRSLIGEEHCIYLTGGDGELFASVLPSAQLVPELVFFGLALVAQVE